MRTNLLIGALLTGWTSLAAQSPTGRLVGKVIDAVHGSALAGAVVELVGVTEPRRTTTAMDGRYSFTSLAIGEVGVRVRMIGFGPKLVTGVRVTADSTTTQDISLNAEMVQLEEVNVTASAERGSVAKALEEQRGAVNIINAITAEQIAKSPDSDASQAVQRVSGVTVQDGKFVIVRGLGERYTTTALNGARIPSPEPERKVVPLDLFPSGLLERITTSKTFTPDQPGDFSGASVNLVTREFPADRVFTLSMSTGLNTLATGKSIVKAPTVGREWLGFSGSERRLPRVVRNAGDLSNTTSLEQSSIIASFRDVWSAKRGQGAPNGSFGLSLGGEDPIIGQRIGYLASLTYSTGSEIRADEQKSNAVNGPVPGTAAPLNTYGGSTARNSVLWGGLMNLSTDLGRSSSIRFNNTYTRSADNEASVLIGDNEEFGDRFQFTRLTFVERSVRSHQLEGEHMLGRRHLVNWTVSTSSVTRNEPDRSDIGYLVREENGAEVPYAWYGAPRFATRTFSNQDETGWDGGAGYQLALGNVSRPVVVKFGGAYRSVDRTTDTRAYDVINRNMTAAELEVPPEQLFTDVNAFAGRLTVRANANAGRYTAADEIVAGYVMLEIPFSDRVRLIGGGRVERWALDVITRTVQGTDVAARPRNTDVLPSIALNLALTTSQNLRLSATQTLSRPEYRELSPVPYFEQVGLLTTFGNPALRRALIQNYDARWEWFPSGGEVVSIGVFAKRFDEPIEKIIVLQAGTAALSYVNATRADNYGVEVELRKNLGVLSSSLLPLTFFANSTLMKSQIEPGSEVLTNSERPMVGQSGYIVNAGLSYVHPSGRFYATTLYNVAGRRIAEAGASGLPDAYEEARHIVDGTLQFTLMRDLSLKLDGKNLLDAPYRFTQGDVLRHRYRAGRVLSFGASWRP